jgi:UDP-N-acetylmuramate--alanine ligase
MAAGVSREEAAPVLARFTGTGRRFELHQLGDLVVVDDYGHHPTEVARTIAAARERFPAATLRVLFQPHLYSRTRHLAWELAAALGAADDVTVTDIYGAREQPVPGVTGKLIVDALSDRGILAGWTPSVESGVERLRRRHAPGDVLLLLGAGDIDRAVGLLGAA